MVAMPAAQRNRVTILIELALVISYFASRLLHLTLLPIFVDESLHISWAVKMAATGRLLGITDAGKFLSIWIMRLFVPVAGDLLWTERLVSVGIGVFGLSGCYLLGRRLFGRQVGLIAAGLYLITPFIFFYDRMALVDGLLTVLAIYVAFFSFELMRGRRVGYGIGLGLVLALAISTKLNGAMLCLLPLLVVGAYLFKPSGAPPWKVLALAYAIAVLGFVPLVAESLLLVDFLSSPHWKREFNKSVVDRSSLLLWQAWLANAVMALHYLTRYVTPTVFLAAGAGGVLAIVRRRRDEMVLLGMAGVIVALFVFISNPERWYPRYLLPAVPFVLLLVARTIAVGAGRLRGYLASRQTRGWAAAVAVGVVLVISLPGLWFDYWLVIDPVGAPLVEIDQFQYINGRTSGYGLPEVAHFLRNELAESQNIFLGYDKSSSYWTGLSVYLYDQRDHIQYAAIDFSRADPDGIVRQLSAAQNISVFVLLRPPFDEGLRIDFDSWPYSRHVAHFDKPDGRTGLDIYQLSASFVPVQPTHPSSQLHPPGIRGIIGETQPMPTLLTP
jgi:hypothetical protein